MKSLQQVYVHQNTTHQVTTIPSYLEWTNESCPSSCTRLYLFFSLPLQHFVRYNMIVQKDEHAVNSHRPNSVQPHTPPHAFSFSMHANACGPVVKHILWKRRSACKRPPLSSAPSKKTAKGAEDREKTKKACIECLGTTVEDRVHAEKSKEEEERCLWSVGFAGDSTVDWGEKESKKRDVDRQVDSCRQLARRRQPDTLLPEEDLYKATGTAMEEQSQSRTEGDQTRRKQERMEQSERKVWVHVYSVQIASRSLADFFPYCQSCARSRASRAFPHLRKGETPRKQSRREAARLSCYVFLLGVST